MGQLFFHEEPVYEISKLQVSNFTEKWNQRPMGHKAHLTEQLSLNVYGHPTIYNG